MMTNTSITVYNKYLDPVAKLDKYQRVVIHDVHWSGVDTAKRVQTGRNEEDKAYIVIPFTSVSGLQFVSPLEFQKLEDKTGYFTLAPEDRIVKGDVPLEITGKVSDLDKAYEAMIVTAVDTRDYGSEHMKHWAVTAK